MSFLRAKGAGLLTAGLAILLCWQLAHWTWVFLEPAPRQPVPADSAANSGRMLEAIRAANLFGSARSSPLPSVAQALTPLDLKLSGVFAAHGKQPALAIINVEHKGDLPFWVGDTVLPDVTLEEVSPDHVVLRRGGVMEKLLLDQKGQALAAPNAKLQLNVLQEGSGRFGLYRSELDKVLSDPSQLANAGRVKAIPGEGMRLEEAGEGSLMSKLGLQSGDIIRQVNGKPVEQPVDLLQSYRTSGQINVEGTRNGQPFEYNYNVR